MLTALYTTEVLPKTEQFNQNDEQQNKVSVALPEYRFVYPEFLPNPDISRRNKIREKLERLDMLNRRTVLDIPEFYVGSVMAVTVSDLNAPGKKSRFVGICIQRAEHGLRAFFILRNVVDGQGIEIKYDLYNPTIQLIEILHLEKRLDEELFYLRDAPQEYSTFPFDMEAIPHREGAPVPVNLTQVKLNPRPWLERWERKELKGIEQLDLPQRFFDRAKTVATPWTKYDLMKEYRSIISEEDQKEIFAEVQEHHKHVSDMGRKVRRKRTLIKPKKSA